MDQSNINLVDYLKEDPTQNISDKLFDKISGLILAGNLPAGFVFPNENILCEQLSVGRSTLREAYKALSAFGYISRLKTGTYVNDAKKIITSAPLGLTLERSAHNDFFEFRLMLEAETAQYAALRATDDELNEIAQIIDEAYEEFEQNNMDMLFMLDVKFHLAVAEATHNVLFHDTMIATSSTWENGVRHNFDVPPDETDFILKTLDQHMALLKAFRKKDGKQARRLMKDHIRFASKHKEEKQADETSTSCDETRYPAQLGARAIAKAIKSP